MVPTGDINILKYTLLAGHFSILQWSKVNGLSASRQSKIVHPLLLSAEKPGDIMW